MYKRKPIKGMLKSADHSPVKVGDNIIFIPEYKANGPKKPKKPSKIDLLIESFNSFRKETNSRFDKIDTNQQGTNSRLDRLEQRVEGIENTQRKQSEQITNLGTKLDTVIRLNNLKTE